MSLFNTDIIEQPIRVGNIFYIDIENFTPNPFYKWVWKEKGVDYPPRYITEAISEQRLRDIIIDKLGNILADDFIKWKIECENNSSRHIHRYFKKIIKREYLSNVAFIFGFLEDYIEITIPTNPIAYTRMIIKFIKK